MTAFRLGPPGDLRPIPRLVQRGAQVTTERVSNEMRTLNGTRRFQRSPRANRTWSLDLGQWRSPEDLAYLTALADGSIPGPVYLYTESAAQTNLLPTSLASPGAMGMSGLRAADPRMDPPRGLVWARMNNVPTQMVGVSCDPDEPGAWSDTVYLPHSDYYSLSVSSTAAGDALHYRKVDLYGDPVGTPYTVTTQLVPGSAPQVFERGQILGTGGPVVGVQFALPPNPDPFFRVGALRLNSYTSMWAGGWLPGEGVPEVVVEDPQRVLQLLVQGRVASDYSITLKEVG